MITAVFLATAIAAAPAAAAPAGKAASIAAPATVPAAARPSGPRQADGLFIDNANDALRRAWVRSSSADWVRKTHITDDTEFLAAELNADALATLAALTRQSLRYDPARSSSPEVARQLKLLRNPSVLAGGLPVIAPADAARQAELAALSARLDSLYGTGRWCGADGKATCRELGELEDVMAASRSWDQLLDAWSGWHTISRPMRPLYARLVELANEGARGVGWKDTGDLWRAGYDMPAADFEADTERLWGEVKPFYDQLHCYVRAELQKKYGKARVPDRQPIPAHLLGNMWAQHWDNLYPDLEPFKGQPSQDVTGALVAQRWDATRMVKLGEAFFTSLGFEPLPASFWTRSQLQKPRDREVVCHASAEDVTYSSDLRIKMCIKPNEEDLITIHHELGHNYYQRAYAHLPVLFRGGANDGFHEAIGDAIALSITPGYLKQVGLLAEQPRDDQGLINVQLKRALAKVAFLPFGKLIDQWRWDVFSGKTPPAKYNEAWWALRARYQGVAPPVARSEADFDAGAKYHIPANVSYTRYFLAHLYQFQFHKALCEAAGWKGPLHQCSIYGSKAAGRKLNDMMALGMSRPWPEAYEVLTGRRKPDAAALLEYFAPLRGWLEKQNAGRACGW
jgi:peptidyl-dipeptidase A